MMRIITWRQTTPPPVGTSPGAVIDAFRGLTQAVKGVPGSNDFQWGFGSGGIVSVGTMESYAVSDALLKDPAVQTAAARIFQLGIGIAEDVFAISPEQAMPFLPQQDAVAATA